VPQAQVKAVSDALIARLQKVVVGDPAQEGVKMGALVNHEQRQDVQDNVNRLVPPDVTCCWAARPIQRRRRLLPANAAVLPAAG
jgi:hypothetical protein